VAQGKHVDVQVISLAQDNEEVGAKLRAEISIEQIRQLQHSASLPPFEGKYKVFIIDGAESLSIEAANCLLKTLEEPVGKVVFILLTTSERLLPATVVSRCQRIELLRSAPSEIEVALVNKWSVEPQKAKLLAGLSHGCLGWAVRAIENDSLEERAGRLDEMIDILDAGNEERFAYSARLVNEFNQNRELVQERLDLWLDWWHDLLLVKTGSNDIVTSIDRLDALTGMAKGYSLSQIRGFIGNIRAAGNQLRQNANPQLVFEVLMLGIPEAEKHGAGSAA
jgi:DNA polymerase-3 subunit delta'